jgi:hypothetical protein
LFPGLFPIMRVGQALSARTACDQRPCHRDSLQLRCALLALGELVACQAEVGEVLEDSVPVDAHSDQRVDRCGRGGKRSMRPSW